MHKGILDLDVHVLKRQWYLKLGRRKFCIYPTIPKFIPFLQWYRWTYLHKRNRLMGIENKCTIVNVIQSLSHVWFFAATWTQHARLPCPTLSPGVCTNSCPLSRWCYPTISSSASPLLILPLIFPSIRIFSNESTLLIRWPKYWSFSFSINLSKDNSGLISFKTDWFHLLVVQGTLRSLLQHHSSKVLWPLTSL